MREALARIEGTRATFQGVFVRYGEAKQYKGPPKRTLLFRDVTDLHGNPMTDHIWFKITKGFEAIGELKPDTLVRFDARVAKYQKGYRGHRDDDDLPPPSTDYRLSHPTNIRRVGSEPIKGLMLFGGTE